MQKITRFFVKLIQHILPDAYFIGCPFDLNRSGCRYGHKWQELFSDGAILGYRVPETFQFRHADVLIDVVRLCAGLDAADAQNH